MQSSFPSEVHARGCVVVSCVRRVRKRVHNAREQAQAKKYISTTGAPQAQMYSPNYLRIAVSRSPRALVPRRAATFSSLALYLRRRICMECIHMKSTILPPTSPSPSFALFSSLLSVPLFRALPRYARIRGNIFGLSLPRGKSH